MRTTFKPCTAIKPSANPHAFCGHVDGNASIAATSTSVASTPLQPASMLTAKPLALLRSTLPIASALLSKIATSCAQKCANPVVQGITK